MLRADTAITVALFYVQELLRDKYYKWDENGQVISTQSEWKEQYYLSLFLHN